ncbi:MAG: hypothetical protein P4L42_12950 [Desulfocapsaceae bacterium]|nr:hypothetical protein [Desulfocapsaceae bacterium]
MGIANKQLEAIFKEISDRFKSNPYITVQPKEGSPPDSYEVIYSITGVQQDKNKEIHEVKSHTIAITIPFGFPHFPPNCKPISAVFHPDFDQAAICIGDFWDKDSTIPDLIIHISHMISGEIFSTDNAFNEEAVLWYKQHKNRLPFEVLDFSTSTPPASASPDKDDALASLDSLEIDTIEESDFKSDFNEFSGEVPAVPQKQAPQIMGVDMDLLMLMAKQKRYWTLQKQLDSISPDIQIQFIDELHDNAKVELAKAQQLLQQGLDYEQKGQPSKALETFKILTATVSDYPEIEEHSKRAEDAVKILYDFNREPGTSDETAGHSEAFAASAKGPRKKDPITFFNEKPEHRAPVLPLVIIGALIILGGLVIYIFATNNATYKHAEEIYADCQDLLQQDNFTAADQKCNEALSVVKGIQFVKGSEKTALIKSIQEILDSQKMRQGLAGKVLRNGQYVPRSDDEALALFNTLSDEGDTFMVTLDWQNARDRYQQAIYILSKTGTIDKSAAEKINTIRKNLAVVQVNLSIETAKKFKESGDYEKAISTLEKAQDNTKSLDEPLRASTIQSIDSILQVVRFLDFKKRADGFFTAGRWQDAADQYHNALDMAKDIPNPPSAEMAELNENSTKADLFAAIQGGKEAFDRAQWDEAIRKYESAILLLNENSKSLKQVSSEENRQKISRIMLQASIIRDKQEVARNLKEGRYKPAIDRLLAIADTVTKSPFNREEEFKEVIKEAHVSIAEARQNQLISECTSYLTDNYKDLFVKNYAATRSDSLSDPKATFVKKIDERLLFKLECTETGQGKPLRLIMNYLFDPASRQWKFFTDTK